MGSDRPTSKPQSRFFPAMKSPMLPKGTFNGRTALITGGGTGIILRCECFLSACTQSSLKCELTVNY
jgi:hypothetical protein